MRRLGLLLLLLALPASLVAQRTRKADLDSLLERARRDSNDASAHYDLAMAHWDLKKWDDAERSLRTAVRVAPSCAEAYLALAVLPGMRGQKYWEQRAEREGIPAVTSVMTEAGLFYRRAFQLNPLVELRVLGKAEESQAVTVTLGDVRLVYRVWWEKELVKAINEFQELRYEQAYARINALAVRGEWGGSDENLPNPILWFHGLAAAHTGKYDLAVRDFALLTGRAHAQEERATAAGLPLVTNDYRYVLATMLFLAGRHEQAAPVYRRALEFDLGLDVAHVQLARIHEAAGRLHDALRERQLAVDVNPEEADPYLELAVTQLKAGQPAAALTSVTTAEGLNPRDARIPLLRASVAYQLGDSSQGRAADERFLAIAPSRMADQIAAARARLGR